MHPHGEFKMVTGKQVIAARALGSWNAEAFSLYQRAMEKAINKISKPFAEILDISEWELGNPEMIEAAKKRNAWSIEQGRSCMVIVYGDQTTVFNITDMSIFSKVDPLSSNGFIHVKTFDEALQYLSTKGFTTQDIDCDCLYSDDDH